MASHSRGRNGSRSQCAQNTPENIQHCSRKLDLPQDVIKYIKIKTTKVTKAIASQGVVLKFEGTGDDTHSCFIQSPVSDGAKDIVDKNVQMLARRTFHLPNIEFFQTLPHGTVVSKLRESKIFAGCHFDYSSGYIDICGDTEKNVQRAFALIIELPGGESFPGSTGQQYAMPRFPAHHGQHHARPRFPGPPGQQHEFPRFTASPGQHHARPRFPGPPGQQHELPRFTAFRGQCHARPRFPGPSGQQHELPRFSAPPGQRPARPRFPGPSGQQHELPRFSAPPGQHHARPMFPGHPGQQHESSRFPAQGGPHHVSASSPPHASQMSNRQNSCSSVDNFQDKLELEIEKLRYLNTTSELKDLKSETVSIDVKPRAGYVEVSGGRREVFSVIEKFHQLTSSYVTKSFPKHKGFVKCLKGVKDAEIITALRAAGVQAGWDVLEVELLLCSDSEVSIDKAAKAVEGLITEYPTHDTLSPAQIEATKDQPEWFALVDRLKKTINVQLEVDHGLSKVLFAVSSDRSNAAIVKLDHFFSSQAKQTCQVDLDTVEMGELFLLNKNFIEDNRGPSGETFSITIEGIVCCLASSSQKGLNHARKRIEAIKKGISSSSIKEKKRGLVTWLRSDSGTNRLKEISSLCHVSYKMWQNEGSVSSVATTSKGRLNVAHDNIAEMAVDGILVGKGVLLSAMEKSCGTRLQEGFHLTMNHQTGRECHVQHVDLPSWSDGSSLQQLIKLVETTLSNFSEKNLEVVSLPAIGAGGLGYPKRKVAETMVTAAGQFLEANPHTSLQKVNFVSYHDDVMAGEFQRAINQFQPMSPSALPTPISQVNVTFLSLTKEKAIEAEKILKNALKDLLVKDRWTNSPHRSFIPQLTPTQITHIQDKARERNVDVKIINNDIKIEGLKSDVFAIRDEINTRLEAFGNQSAVPANWKKDSSGQVNLLVTVSSTKREYDKVKTHFLQSCSQHAVTVMEVQRVQNEELYKMYQACKQKVEKEVRGEMVVERRLWHGTDASSVMSICKNEFNRSFAGKNGTVYGQGSYFSMTSGYSVSYSKDQGDKYIILAKVATGRYILGSSSMDRKSLPENYHSTVDNESNPSIFVVYHDASAYPQYVVKFRCS